MVNRLMRCLFALALLCGLAQAQAQALTESPTQDRAPDVGACMFKELPTGDGTPIKFAQVPGAEGAYWYCPKQARFTRYVVRLAWLDGFKPVKPDLAGLTPSQSVAALWRTNVTMNCDEADNDAAHPLHAICTALKAAAEADPDKPPHPTWRVKPYGTLATRAMYSIAISDAGVITWKDVAVRAPVGELCLCKNWSMLKGRETMCPLDREVIEGATFCTRSSD